MSEQPKRETVFFPVPKDLVEQLIKVYSEFPECGGCNSVPIKTTCCVCKKQWVMHEDCPNYEARCEYCDNCEGLICKECIDSCPPRYPRIKKGIREQVFCEYDLEKGREFERSDRVFENGKIHSYVDEFSHQSREGNFLCGPCAQNVPRCEKCNCTLYLCTYVSGDGCRDKPDRAIELKRLHDQFGCK